MAFEIPSLVLVGKFNAGPIREGLADVKRNLQAAGREAKSFAGDVARIGKEADYSAASMGLFGALSIAGLVKLASVGPETSIGLAKAGLAATELGLTLDKSVGPVVNAVADGLLALNGILSKSDDQLSSVDKLLKSIAIDGGIALAALKLFGPEGAVIAVGAAEAYQHPKQFLGAAVGNQNAGTATFDTANMLLHPHDTNVASDIANDFFNFINRTVHIHTQAVTLDTNSLYSGK